MTTTFELVFDAGQFLGPLQQAVVREGGNGGRDRVSTSVVHSITIIMESI